MAVLGPLGAKLADVQEDDAIASLPRDSEATTAYNRAAQAFPDSNALIAVAVYTRAGGLTDADRAKVAADRTAFVPLAVDGVVGPEVATRDIRRSDPGGV